jgi:acetyltransferase-like isoleucine patch superfamily enzyme
VSNFEVELGLGLNIMAQAIIGPRTRIGDGVLINSGSHVHHDVSIGNYSEISPMASVLGGSCIEEEARIGTGAIILPGIKVGASATVGAGAVVDRNVEAGDIVVGIPARSTKK